MPPKRGVKRHGRKSRVLLNQSVLCLGRKAAPNHKPDFHLLRMLRYFGAPLIFLKIVYLATNPSTMGPMTPIDSLELFAGKKAFTKAVLDTGRVAIGIDLSDATNILQSDLYNFLTARGFILATNFAARLGLGAQHLTAPVCSTWVWLSRGSTGRSELNPLGNTRLCSVSEANIMVSRVCLIIMICLAKGVFFVCEQPRGSLLQLHPKFQRLVKTVNLVRKHIFMKDFGGKSDKPTWLYTTHPCIDDIDLFKVPYKGTVESLVKRDNTHGKERITGNGKLKQSQHYPPAFGRALAKVYMKNKAATITSVSALVDWEQ
jgi:hypothetical protein